MFWTKFKLAQACKQRGLKKYSQLNKEDLWNLVKRDATRTIQAWWVYILFQRKRCQQVNQTDLVCMEEFSDQNPHDFFVYDYPQKKKFAFKIQDLHEYIVSVKQLKNPYNNLPLSDADVYRLCSSHLPSPLEIRALVRSIVNDEECCDCEMRNTENNPYSILTTNIHYLYQETLMTIMHGELSNDLFCIWFATEIVANLRSTLGHMIAIDAYSTCRILVDFISDLSSISGDHEQISIFLSFFSSYNNIELPIYLYQLGIVSSSLVPST